MGASWRARYDSLILNTPRITSTLAGYRMPRRYGRWPTRDDVVEYLQEYARREGLKIRFGVELSRVQRRNGGWALETSAGELESGQVVIATGHDVEPLMPDWPGKDEFPGELIHSADYRNAEPYGGRNVLVVAASTSGSEIAYELDSNGAERVWTSMRTPPPIFPREWPFGMPVNYPACGLDLLPDRVADRVAGLTQWLIYGNLSRHGLPRCPVGPQTRTKNLHQGALVDAGFVEALKEGRIELVAAVERFDGAEVVLVDGTRMRPDAVVAATGYQARPRAAARSPRRPGCGRQPGGVRGRTHPAAPGLYFNGFYASLSGQLRHMRRHARAIARAIDARPATSTGRRLSFPLRLPGRARFRAAYRRRSSGSRARSGRR